MRKLSETTSRISRAIVADCKLMNLFGKQILATFICKTCIKAHLMGEAYVPSKRKSRHKSDIRPYCVNCWIKHNGKTYAALKKEPSTSSLDDFLPKD